MEAIITKSDRHGRIRSTSESSNPVTTYNNWRKEAAPRLKREQEIRSKYNKKIASAKTQNEKERLEFEMIEELEDIG